MRKVYLPWDSTALVAATAKTIAEIPTPATTDIELCELVIGCDASSAGNLKIEFGTFTTTGTGTAVSAPGIYQSSDRTPASLITAAKISDSVEPTSFTTTGTGTAVSAPGIYQASDRTPASLITAAKISDTVEPTSFTTVISGNAKWPILLVPLPMYFPFQLPLGEGLTIPNNTKFGIRLTASIACNTAGWAAWKE